MESLEDVYHEALNKTNARIEELESEVEHYKQAYEALDQAYFKLHEQSLSKHYAQHCRIKELEKVLRKIKRAIKNVNNPDYDYEPSHAYDHIVDAVEALEKRRSN